MGDFETVRSLLFTKHRLIDGCDKLTGRESYSELLALIATPQGREFCAENDFPDLDTSYAIHGIHPEECQRQGIYVDAGFIRIQNPEQKQITLVGKTFAHILLTEPRDFYILTLHGAIATVEAAGYSVVRTAASPSSAIQATISEQGTLIQD